MTGKPDRAFLGTGWSFPPRPDSRGGISLAAGEESIEQSIGIIISTAPGERVYRPEFGCAIQDLLFSPNNARTRALAKHYVQEALVRWEPRIRAVRVEAEPDGKVEDRLLLRIGYEIRATNHPKNLVHPFYLQPGSAGTHGEGRRGT
jgi:phage baseplate assembly protein W